MKTNISNINYFLCSKSVVDFAKPNEVSKPFKSGYHSDDYYFIAILDFNKIEEHYNKLSDDEQYSFWREEIVPGTMNINSITLKSLKDNGLFFEIERQIGLTKTKNIAMTIYNLSEKFNCTPIQFINKIC